MKTVWAIRQDDLSNEQTRALVRLHLEGMQAHSPPGSVFALDFAGLTAPVVTLWSAWHGDYICGIGALKVLSEQIGLCKALQATRRLSKDLRSRI
jgi:putative acetyltransferase